MAAALLGKQSKYQILFAPKLSIDKMQGERGSFLCNPRLKSVIFYKTWRRGRKIGDECSLDRLYNVHLYTAA